LGAAPLAGCGRGPLYEQGVEALKEGEDVAARAYLTKAISRHPGSGNNARAYNLIGVACWRLGELEQARQNFEASRNVDPTLAVAAYNLGVLNAATTNDAQAAALLHEAALLDSSDPRPLEYLAHLAAGRGRWEDAEDLLTRALERSPRAPRVLSALALAELHTRGARQALARLGAAIDAEPDYGPAYLNLAVISSTHFQDDAEAVVWLDKYLALVGGDAPPEGAKTWRDALAARLPPMPATTNAIEQARARLEPPPTSGRSETDTDHETQAGQRKEAIAAYNQGTVAHARRQWDAAITAYRRALEKDPTFDLAHMNLATALHEAGRDRDAVLELQRIVSRQPSHAKAHYLLGLIFSAQEQTRPEAEKHYRKFLDLRPNDPAAQRVRAWLSR
jgi:tetratricopeptide (TPR) repeat protein